MGYTKGDLVHSMETVLGEASRSESIYTRNCYGDMCPKEFCPYTSFKEDKSLRGTY